MPDSEGKAKADEETLPQSPLHAYKEGRTEDMKGDVDKVLSTDPDTQRPRKIEDDDELELPHEKH
ncbi:MAG: hypothetical protein M3Y09_12330 [Actinomycetota bacterium]|nr:hypothetical protein [Actinomycetota bacterium]